MEDTIAAADDDRSACIDVDKDGGDGQGGVRRQLQRIAASRSADNSDVEDTLPPRHQREQAPVLHGMLGDVEHCLFC
jgi:hypothetical protein